jgi:hypothetical protein
MKSLDEKQWDDLRVGLATLSRPNETLVETLERITACEVRSVVRRQVLDAAPPLPVVPAAEEGLVGRVRLLVKQFRAVGGIPELCALTWELCNKNERLNAALIDQRSIGHGEGQRDAIADVNAGRVDDLIQQRLSALPVVPAAEEPSVPPQRDISALIEALVVRDAGEVLDARRYQRLRILGCAPYGSDVLERSTVLRFQGLDTFVDDDIRIMPSRGEFHAPPLRAPSPSTPCEHNFKIPAWRRHEVVGTHCWKCGALDPTFAAPSPSAQEPKTICGKTAGEQSGALLCNLTPRHTGPHSWEPR